MLVRFLKNHVNWKLGQQAEFEEPFGNYLIRCNVVESCDANPAKTEAILLQHLEDNKPKPQKPKQK